MLAGVYSAASALRAAELQQDVIATNLAHLNVPGFRKSILSFATFAEELDAQQDNEPGYGTTTESIAIDFTEGPIVETSRKLDAAILGDGFFAVQGENQTLYTRNGTFHIGADGSLVNATGMPVLGENGPLTVPGDVSPSQIVISSDGTVSAGDVPIGKLRLARFEDNAGLQQVGTTLFSAGEGVEPLDADVTVRQGAREQSNVSPIDELVAMIVALRYHEAAQRTLKSLNDAIEQQTTP